MENFYNKWVRVKNLKSREQVVRKNEANHLETHDKLSTTWEGPYKVVEMHRDGVYTLEAQNGRPIHKTCNTHNLSHFYT